MASILFIGCDNEAPTVSIVYPPNSYISNHDVDIRVEALDNNAVQYVDIMVDGKTVAIDSTAPYEANVLLTVYNPGPHTVSAKAYDKRGNSAISDPVSMTYVYDILPNANAYLRVSILSYKGDGTADDPYFTIILYENGDSIKAVSNVYEDEFSLNNPFSHDFDIDDGSKSATVAIKIKDDNLLLMPTPIDYTPDPGYFYKAALATDKLPLKYSYDGSEDHREPEADCQMEVEFSIVAGS